MTRAILIIPIQILGIAKGSHSLAGGTVGGGLSSTARFSSAVSRGISATSSDKEFKQVFFFFRGLVVSKMLCLVLKKILNVSIEK